MESTEDDDAPSQRRRGKRPREEDDDRPCDKRSKVSRDHDDDMEKALLALADTASVPSAPVKPSDEQAQALKAFHQGCNVQMDAVAGAGKTTTLLLFAYHTPRKRFEIFTYNKDLQRAMEQRAREWNLTNVRCRTYHSAAGIAYGSLIRDDTSFLKAIAKPPPFKERLACDVLMLDEAQDMSVIFYQFVWYLLCKKLQVVVVGDPLQAINGYMGARVEFLTQSSRWFVTSRPWKRCTLSTSYRLTPATARFVNRQVVQTQVLQGGNLHDPNLKPIYVGIKYKTGAPRMWEALSAVIRTYGYENVAILAPSVRTVATNKSPLGLLVRNYLCHIPLYIPSTDTEKIDAQVCKGKLRLLTFHQSKGCEFDCAFIYCFDENYFKFYEKTWGKRSGVPNTLYVATTRPRKQLVVVANVECTLRTIDHKTLEHDVQAPLSDDIGPPLKMVGNPKETRTMDVSTLIRHIDVATIALMRTVLVETSRRKVPVPSRTTKTFVGFLNTSSNASYTEDVSPIYGIMIPILAALRKTGTTVYDAKDSKHRLTRPEIVRDMRDADPGSMAITPEALASYPPRFWDDLEDAQAMDPAKRSWEQWARMAITYQAFQSGAHHIARQILDYKWVDGAFVEACVDALVDTLKERKGEFEVQLAPKTVKRQRVWGVADFIDDKKEVWVFKCTSTIQEEHILQLGCCLALSGHTVGHIYALLSGEIVTVQLTDEDKLLELAVSRLDPKGELVDMEQVVERFRKQHVQRVAGA